MNAWEVFDDYRYIGFALIRLGGDGEFLKVTEAFANILGRTREEVMKETVCSLSLPEDRDHARMALKLGVPRLRVLKNYLHPVKGIVTCEFETTKVSHDTVLSVLWVPTVLKEDEHERNELKEELDNVKCERDEILSTLREVYRKSHELMLHALKSNKGTPVDVKIFNQQSDGDNNENNQGGEVTQK